MRTWQTGQMRPERIGRRQFSVAALALLVGAITIGCGGASKSPTSPTPTPSQDQYTFGVVSGNHPLPHVAAISPAQLSAGAGITLDIFNGSHSHTVTLTGAEIVQIAAKARVFVESSTNPHSNGADPHAHTVTFN